MSFGFASGSMAVRMVRARSAAEIPVVTLPRFDGHGEGRPEARAVLSRTIIGEVELVAAAPR